jgi:histidinol phosphatase-like enzyme
MKLNLNDLVRYVAADERLHIWTCVGVLLLGAIMIYLFVIYLRVSRRLDGTQKALDTTTEIGTRLQSETAIWRKLFGPFPALYDNSPEFESYNHNDATVAIDLDGVILEYVDPWNGICHFGAPIPGAAASIKALKESGFKIVIYTTRNNALACHNSGHNALELTALVQRELEKAGIVYDFIALFKPLARYYIDDRAIRFVTWRSTLADISFQETVRATNKVEDMQARFQPIVLGEPND